MERGESLAGTCLRCDNRHGCRSAAPLCEALDEDPAERGLLGRERMARRGLLGQCPACSCFRQCWSLTAYQRALRG